MRTTLVLIEFWAIGPRDGQLGFRHGTLRGLPGLLPRGQPTGVCLDLLGLRRRPPPAQQPWPSREGHVPAGRVPGHFLRAKNAAFDGTVAVPAGHLEGVVPTATPTM